MKMKAPISPTHEWLTKLDGDRLDNTKLTPQITNETLHNECTYKL